MLGQRMVREWSENSQRTVKVFSAGSAKEVVNFDINYLCIGTVEKFEINLACK